MDDLNHILSQSQPETEIPQTTVIMGTPKKTKKPFSSFTLIPIIAIFLFIIVSIVSFVFYLFQKNENKFSKNNASGFGLYLQENKNTEPAATPVPAPQPTTPTPTPEPQVSPGKKSIHVYPADWYGADPKTLINKVNIISLFFVPQDIDTPVKNEWLINLERVNKKIKAFFEKEFQNNIEITYQIVSQPIRGDKNIGEYGSAYSLTLEAVEKTKNFEKSGFLNSRMIYLVRDSKYEKNISAGALGGVAPLNSATQYEFWLDNNMVQSLEETGIKNSAHEFGHALGIPHPWELPANANNDPNFGNVAGDLMAYGDNSNVALESMYLRDDVKKIMGL